MDSGDLRISVPNDLFRLVSVKFSKFIVSVQPSSYTGCGRLLSTRDALELHKAIASQLLNSIPSENEGKGLPYTFTKTLSLP